jgi:hypothetical protein
LKQYVAIVGIVLMSGCVGISPHSTPSSITDTEIGMYKLGMQKGCTDQGISKGDDPEKVKKLCGCALDVLNQSLTHEQWQEATFAAQNKRGGDEAKVMAPYMPQIRACKM